MLQTTLSLIIVTMNIICFGRKLRAHCCGVVFFHRKYTEHRQTNKRSIHQNTKNLHPNSYKVVCVFNLPGSGVPLQNSSTVSYTLSCLPIFVRLLRMKANE